MSEEKDIQSVAHFNSGLPKKCPEVPTSPTSPASSYMSPKVFSNKPPKLAAGVVKVVPVNYRENLPSFDPTNKEKNHRIPRPVPLKRQPSTLTLAPSQTSFSSTTRSTSKDIPVLANAASKAYIQAVSPHSGDNLIISSSSMFPTPTSPVSPPPSKSTLSATNSTSRLRVMSSARTKSAMTSTPVKEVTQPIASKRTQVKRGGIIQDIGQNESKSSVFKSTSSFFQAAREKSFSVSQRLASSSNAKFESVSRSIPRNVRRVLKPQRNVQNASPQPTIQQPYVPFFKPLEASEELKDTNVTGGSEKPSHCYRNRPTIEGKGTDINDGALSLRGRDAPNSAFNAASSSLFRTSSASSASTGSRKSFLTTLRPHIKVTGPRVTGSTKGRAKSETLPKIFPRGGKPPKMPTHAIPRGRTVVDMSTNDNVMKSNRNKSSPLSIGSSQREIRKQDLGENPPESSVTRFQKSPLKLKRVSSKANSTIHLSKSDENEGFPSQSTLLSGCAPASVEGRVTDEFGKTSRHENEGNFIYSDLPTEKKKLVRFAKVVPQNGGVLNSSVSVQKIDILNNLCSSLPEKSAASSNPLDEDNDLGSVTINRAESGDGNTILLQRTMSVVKFPRRNLGDHSEKKKPESGKETIDSTGVGEFAIGYKNDVEVDEKLTCKSQQSPICDTTSERQNNFPQQAKKALHAGERLQDFPTPGRHEQQGISQIVSGEKRNDGSFESGNIYEDYQMINDFSKQANLHPRSKTEPVLGYKSVSSEPSRRASDCAFSIHRTRRYPTYQILSDWFESDLRESDLSPAVLPAEDDLKNLSHIQPVQWASLNHQYCHDLFCLNGFAKHELSEWTLPAPPYLHSVMRSNSAPFFNPYSSTACPSCNCVTCFSCQAYQSTQRQPITAKASGSLPCQSSPPVVVEGLNVGGCFKHFARDFQMGRRIMHLELIQRQLREKIRLSKCSEKGVHAQMTKI